jgi:hypothetical protein
MTKLFLDDVRNPPDDTWHVVRSYVEFVAYIMSSGVPDVISFDHDLGRGEAQRRVGNWVPRAEYKELKTGYDCAKWLIESGYNVKSWQVHSMNPVGAANIRKYLETAQEQTDRA